MVGHASVTPVLRSFDEVKAREFYVDFLGFEVVFEHRFGENFPLYLGIRRDDVVLHLSEHHGDCSPGALVRIATGDVKQLSAMLAAKNYRFAKPGEPQENALGLARGDADGSVRQQAGVSSAEGVNAHASMTSYLPLRASYSARGIGRKV